MLRPATPLTILLFAALVLLIISVISTPIVKAIPLAQFDGVDFGVFGFCQGDKCSSIEIGYNTAKFFDNDQNSSFDLPTATRTTLSAILIVHPIAALFTLIMLILAASAHFHSPSHSPRYLLGIFILSILTLILSLLAFLIDVLLFVPHMAWGSYIVLAATILIAASGIVSCAMRRTLVSRKARKRRIEENAEMNGENFYARQATTAPTAGSNTLVNRDPDVDKLPAFATFEMAKKEDDRTSDERIPLTTRTPSETSPNNVPGSAGTDRYRGPSPPRDQYGNPMPAPPAGAYGMRSRDPSADPSLNRQYSDTSMGSRGRGMPYRGRGGYGPPGGRGGYGPPPPGARGGYRGGYGDPRGRGGFGPPGPYRGQNDAMMAGAGGMAAGAMMRGGRGGPPPGYGRGGFNRGMSPYGNRSPPDGQDLYGRNVSPRPPPVGDYAAYNPSSPDESRSSLPRAESPPPLPGLDPEGPVGQAVEMDASTGSPSHPPKGFGTQLGQLRDSDGDVAGMVGLQQQRQNLARDTQISEGSRYSSDEPYVPPRQAWVEGGRSSPLNPASQAAELSTSNPSGHKRVGSGDNYYEDVDPRFVDEPPATNSLVPAALAHGYPTGGSNAALQPLRIDGNNSYEDVQSGSRSPAESERSNFTSVSQRGVNPRWNGGQNGYGAPAPMPNRRPTNTPPRNDILLNNNPDFQLPGARGGRVDGSGRGRGPPGSGMVPGSAYPGGAL